MDRHANESVCTPQWLPEAKAATAASAARLSKTSTTCAQVKTKIDCMAKEMMAVLCSYNFCSAVAPSRAEWAGGALSIATDGQVEALTEAASKGICEEGGDFQHLKIDANAVKVPKSSRRGPSQLFSKVHAGNAGSKTY